MHTAAGPTQARSGLGPRRLPAPRAALALTPRVPASITRVVHGTATVYGLDSRSKVRNDLTATSLPPSLCCVPSPKSWKTLKKGFMPWFSGFSSLSYMMSAASAAVCVVIRSSELQNNRSVIHSQQITQFRHEASADSISALRRSFGKHLGIPKEFG